MSTPVVVTIRLDGDAADLKAAMAQAEQSIRSALDAAPAGAAKTKAALQGVGDESKRSAGGVHAFTQGLRDQIAVMGKSEADVLRYKAAQAGVGAEAAPLILQLQNMRAALQAKAQEDIEAAAAARTHAEALQRQQAAQQQFLAQLRERVDTQGMDPEQLLRYRAAQLGVTQQADALIGRLRAQGQAAQVSAGQTRAAMAMLPAQFTDVFTSLAGGMNPLLVLIQQGGQIRDSFGGIGAALRAIGSFITPTTVAIGGLVAVGGGLAAAFVMGSNEADRLTRSLEVTGNAAGVTAGSFGAMADRVQAASGATAGAARQALAAVVAMGNVGPQAIEPLASAVASYARLTGKSVDDVIGQFDRLRDDAAAWAVDMNKSTNFLTAATFQRIRALQEQGRGEAAAAEAAREFGSAMAQRDQRLTQNLNALGRAAREAGDFLSNMWTAAKGIGQSETAEERIGRLRARVQELQGQAPTTGLGAQQRGAQAFTGALFDRLTGGGALSRAQAELAAAEAAQNRGALNAAEQAADAATNRRQIGAARTLQPDFNLGALPRTAEQVQRETRLTLDAIERVRRDAIDGAAGNVALIESYNRTAREAAATTAREGAEALASLANAATAQGRAVASANIDAGVAAARRAAEAAIRTADDREQQLAVLRERGLMNERDVIAETAALDARRIAARRAAVEQEIALESQRPLPAGDPSARIARNARVADLRGQLDALDAEAGQAAAQAAADASRALYAEADARFDATARAIDSAQAQVRQMVDANRQAAIGLITDPVQRATAQAEADIADLQRAADDLSAALRRALTLAQLNDPEDRSGQQSALRAQLGEVSRATEEAIAARTAGLTRELQPAWQTLVDGWRNTNRQMRETWDETFEDMVRGAEDALTGLFRNGKLNGSGLVDSLLNGMARNLARQTLAAANVEGVGGALRSASGMGGPEAMSASWSSLWESIKSGTVIQDAWNLVSRTTQMTQTTATQTAATSMGALTSAATSAAMALRMMSASGGGGGGGSGGMIANLLGSFLGGGGASGFSLGGGSGTTLGIPGQGLRPSVRPPGFAAGGDHAGGWRIVGERGPELEATGPARIFNADQTARMLSGGGGQTVVQNNIQVVNNAPGVAVREERTTGPDGSQMTRLIIEQAAAAAKGQIAREVSEGRGIAGAFESRYGLRPSNMPRTA